MNYHNHFRLRNEFGLELTDSLEIHLLELPKYSVPSDNVEIADPIEQWMYFFRKAHGSQPEALANKLRDPIFVVATGVLEMIARSPEERRLYEARLKMERDINTGIQAALAEGEINGKIKGKIEGEIEGEIKLIRAFQEILGITISDEKTLHSMDFDDVRKLADDMQQRVRGRRLL